MVFLRRNIQSDDQERVLDLFSVQFKLRGKHQKAKAVSVSERTR